MALNRFLLGNINSKEQDGFKSCDNKKIKNQKVYMPFRMSAAILLASLSISAPSFAQLKNIPNTAEQPKKMNDKDANELVFAYCYALQASALCKGLQMRLDTESKIEQIVGGKFRGPEGSHNQICMQAIMKADADEKNGVCRTAWDKYGCFGSERPRLLQQSLSMGANAATCPF